MLTRCYNASGGDVANYQARGIIVCERWRKSFPNFLEDMGHPPSSGHSLDRFPDVDGNYEPSNCRWATKLEQANNVRNNILITFAGKTLTLKQWSRELTGFPYNSLFYRFKAGWTVERMFSVPINLNKGATRRKRTIPR